MEPPFVFENALAKFLKGTNLEGKVTLLGLTDNNWKKTGPAICVRVATDLADSMSDLGAGKPKNDHRQMVKALMDSPAFSKFQREYLRHSR